MKRTNQCVATLGRRLGVAGCVVAGLAMWAVPVLGQLAPLDEPLDYGMEEMPIVPATPVNANSPRTVELLADAMRREAGFLRAQRVHEIGLLELSEGLPVIRQAMRDDDPAVRAEAARAAANIGDDSILPDVERLLADPDAMVRRAAVVAHVTLEGERESASPAIRTGLDDADSGVRFAALRQVRIPADGDLIVQRLEELSPAEQVKAIRTLGRARAIDHASVVQGYLDHSGIAHRAAAAEALGQMEAADHLQQIMAAFGDPHPTVRRSAVEALAGTAPADVQQREAINMLDDPDLSVRAAAASLLIAHPLLEAVEPLLRQLPEQYGPLNQAARDALVASEEPEITEPVIAAAVELLADPDPRRREDGSYILGMLRSNAGMERHIALLDFNDSTLDLPVIIQALKSLGWIGDERAGEAIVAVMGESPGMLHRLLDGPSGAGVTAQEQAAVAAGRLRYRPAIRALNRILGGSAEHDPPQPRGAATWALGVIAPDTNPNRFLGIYDDGEEHDPTKFEALKALGNIANSAAAEDLDIIRQRENDPRLRWAAHWAYERTIGEPVPYDPPVSPWEAPVTIRDWPE